MTTKVDRRIPRPRMPDDMVDTLSALWLKLREKGFITDSRLGDLAYLDTVGTEQLADSVLLPVGSVTATTIEVDLGSAATWRGRFVITNAAISPASKIFVWQAPGPYTGKGTLADEAEMQPVSIISTTPGSGSALVSWETPPREAPYTKPRIPFTLGFKDPQSIGLINVRRIGKVRGNVKFTYLVLS